MIHENKTFHAPGLGRGVLIETYGCQMNVADSLLIEGVLELAGFRIVQKIAEADLVLINTCAVRERAVTKVMRRLVHLAAFKRGHPGFMIGICGCIAEQLKQKLLERVPEIDMVVGPDSYRRLPDLIGSVDGGASIVDVRFDRGETYEGLVTNKVDGVQGWVSIQRGCDKFCTYCVVPFVRGRERSCSPQEVLRQVRALVDQGAVEIALLGQTVTSYIHRDEKGDLLFADLLRAVSEVEGVKRVRFTSPHPLDFSSELISAIAETPEVMPHVHLPVQSGSDRILDLMKRGHSVREYLQVVHSLREAIPEISITTDLIVGFPGECEDSYLETLDLVKRVGFDSSFMFAYSERTPTFASKHYEDDVSHDLKIERLAGLIDCQEEISRLKFAGIVGQVVPVLVTGPSKRSQDRLTGKSDAFKTTVFDRPEVYTNEVYTNEVHITPGTVVDVRITSSTSHTLLGSFCCVRG